MIRPDESTIESLTRGGPRPRYTILANREQRKEMESEIAAFIGSVAFMNPDVLMYLDVSARPISWVVNAVLRAKFPDKQRPETKFMNFGKERSIIFDHAPVDQIGYVMAKNPKVQEMVSILRREYGKRNGGTYLDGKRIWLVDEVSFSGASLEGAKQLITLSVGDTLPEPVMAHSVLSAEPVWYENKWMSEVEDNGPASLLSRPTYNSSRQLRQELKEVAQDILAKY